MGMAIIRTMRRQKAVYWGSPVPDGRGGRTTAIPVEIDCRWDAGGEVVRSLAGEEFVSSAEVFVDRDVDEGGYLLLGELTDIDDTKTASENGATLIRKFEKTPVLKVAETETNADEYLRIAYL